MTLATGRRLGPYEIVAPLGAGGMGEVYRAKDSRLDRTVAIKVLPEHLSKNPELEERFAREAKAISSLNHPHICTLYDIGHEDGVTFMVMELIEGETLVDRLKKGALPLDEALEYGVQIADALDNAHRKRVVHRDLKPGNVMLTATGVKLLDFDLAKSVSPADPAASGLSGLPTEEKPLTREGSILGTLQYMAPEQLEAKDVDARTDIFAFGSVLYEMMTGSKAFAGKSQASLITAIMSAEPAPISALQPMTPALLDRLVRKCLAKDPEERWQTARDLKDELSWIAKSEVEVAPVRAARGTARLLGPAVGIVIGALLTAFVFWSSARAPDTSDRVRRVAITLPSEAGLKPSTMGGLFWDSGLALAPSGDRLVYVSDREGVNQLYVRDLAEREPRPIAGTEGAALPFFSPDGEWVGYFDRSRGVIRKVSLAGEPPTTVCTYAREREVGASWGDDGFIVFATSGAGLRRISAAGGTPEVLTVPDLERGEWSHSFPNVLPGSSAVLFTASDYDLSNTAKLVVVETSEVRALAENAYAPRYLPTGHVAFLRDGSVVVAPFELRRLEITGSQVSVTETGMSQLAFPFLFSVSRDGSVVYVEGNSGESVFGGKADFVWVDRAGREEKLNWQGAPFAFGAYLSPDGTHVLFQGIDPVTTNSDIWLVNLARERATRLTFDVAADWAPIWETDGAHFVFGSTRGGQPGIYRKSADGSGPVELVFRSPYMLSPHAWSAGGKDLLTVRMNPETGMDIWVSSLGAELREQALLHSPADELWPDISPDGRFMVYGSDESGRMEIYVRPFPDIEAGKWQVSSDGGREPKWHREGGELLYRGEKGMVAVEVETEPTFAVVQSRVLFEDRYRDTRFTGPALYSLSPDGRRFLLTRQASDEVAPITELVFVENWLAEVVSKAGSAP